MVTTHMESPDRYRSGIRARLAAWQEVERARSELLGHGGREVAPIGPTAGEQSLAVAVVARGNIIEVAAEAMPPPVHARRGVRV